MRLFGGKTQLTGTVGADGRVRASGIWANPTGGFPGMTVLNGQVTDGVLDGTATDFRCHTRSGCGGCPPHGPVQPRGDCLGPVREARRSSAPPISLLRSPRVAGINRERTVHVCQPPCHYSVPPSPPAFPLRPVWAQASSVVRIGVLTDLSASTAT